RFDCDWSSDVCSSDLLIRLWKHEGTTINKESLSPVEHQAQLDAYEESVAAQDSVVGTILDSLARLGVLSHTLVVITADHGEQFRSEERRVGKEGRCPW